MTQMPLAVACVREALSENGRSSLRRSGGNGEVWFAESGDECSAVKIFHRTGATDYERFRREVKTCKEIDSTAIPLGTLVAAGLGVSYSVAPFSIAHLASRSVGIDLCAWEALMRGP